jgi:hypothetical protein
MNWSVLGNDETPKLLGDLVPPNKSFTAGWVSGIMLKSDPNGYPSSDYNYTSFNLKSYYSDDDYYKKYYSYMSYDDYKKCGAYEDYIKNVTKFVFDDALIITGSTSQVPLPGAFLLMGTVIMGASGVSFLRRRRKREIAYRLSES